MGLQLTKDPAAGTWIALTGGPRDGAVVKAAGGFRFEGVVGGQGRWVTADAKTASLLAQFATPALRAELEGAAAAAEAAPPPPLLRLERRGATYLAIGGYDANPVIKAAGFRRWDPQARAWTTTEIEVAAKLARFAEPALRAELESTAARLRTEAETAIEASRATDDAAAEIPIPAGLSYLGYQKAGINYALRQMGIPGIGGVLIGDDMGLGKTVQAIGLANARPDIRRVLVVCPASLRLNWLREWRRWTTRDMKADMATTARWPEDAEVVVLNYDIVGKLRDRIDAVAWDLLVLDESHVLKNAKAQRTRAVLGGGGKGKDAAKPIAARLRVFLTGTAILNRPVELWTTVQACDPEGLGANFMGFAKRYCAAHQTRFGWDFTGASHLDELQTRMRSRFMVRRLKADVLTELPEKRRQLIELAANGAGAIVAAERKAAEALEDRVARARAAVLLAEAEGDRNAYRRAVEALRTAQAAAFTEMSKLRHDTAVKKIPYLIEHLREAIEASGKVICFVHHKDVVDALKAEFGGAAVAITGETKLTDRQAAVDRFQADASCTLFIGNILAAGVGITLTASSHVVFGELDWRPGIVTQAEDRAHRIGQRNSVLVQHIVFEDSIDAVMAKRIIAKQEVIDRALDKDAAALDADDGAVDVLLAGVEAAQAEAEATRAARLESAIEATERAAAPFAAAHAAEGKPRWQVLEEARERKWAALDGEAAAMTPAQVAAVHQGLRLLAGLDADHAMQRNDAGFNKPDSYAGHALAEKPALTSRQAAAGRAMLRKYRGQLGDGLMAEMGA
jgi:SNF2-related domain/Helicase conserved C-terminal domain